MLKIKLKTIIDIIDGAVVKKFKEAFNYITLSAMKIWQLSPFLNDIDIIWKFKEFKFQLVAIFPFLKLFNKQYL